MRAILQPVNGLLLTRSTLSYYPMFQWTSHMAAGGKSQVVNHRTAIQKPNSPLSRPSKLGRSVNSCNGQYILNQSGVNTMIYVIRDSKVNCQRRMATNQGNFPLTGLVRTCIQCCGGIWCKFGHK